MLPFRGLSVWLPVRLSRSCIVPKWQKISTGFLLHTTAPHFHMFQQHFILFYFIELTMLLSASFTCLDACCCHGLRLPVFNKETTYLLTWNGVSKSNSFRDMRSKHTGVTSLTFSRSRDASRGKNGTNMFIKQQRVTQYNYNVTNDRHRHPDRRTQHCSIDATVSTVGTCLTVWLHFYTWYVFMILIYGRCISERSATLFYSRAFVLYT